MRIEILATVNDPGKPGHTGDDRLGFDGAAGTAWVLDGATDVTDLRPFPSAESGAAWFAGALSDRLMAGPATGEPVANYFARVLSDVRGRAETESVLPLDSLPGEALPIAAGVWMWLQGEEAVFAHTGDCMAFVRSGGMVRVVGQADKAEDETAAARALLALPYEDQIAKLQEGRRATNEAGACFGLGPKVVGNIRTERIVLAPGDEVCLMSDGLYRLISPYATHTPESFMQDLASLGLDGLIRALRAFENTSGGDIPRFKSRDDAAGVYLTIEA